ncbi:coiled-coil domain-containing protein 43 isoform X1 [Anoplophora glabripennis]|uniref:coiled-coil domain-containing protein 43 isoform X1 n=1 Tax=Anoplophora glabripennis TaxID=217634 RepID=UPI000873978E|nr:coiled-coil domain-containing protein 43 isoform X1 [Anoplophora glabripennis]
MATAIQDFPNWLNEKLQELNTDETVFGSYIQGILDSDESFEEKSEALQGILAEIVENVCLYLPLFILIITEKWHIFKPKEPPPSQMSSEDVNNKLAKLLESQSLAITKQRQYTEEERKIREAILSQYSQMTDDEDENEEKNGTVDENRIEKNLNAQTVLQAEKSKREQARIESQKKKEKDKEDREKQKQLKEEKKEKRKTVKGERKR